MARKKNQDKETTVTDYYDLKTKDVDELVAALKDESPADAPPVTTDIEEITGEKPDAKPGSKGTKFDPYRRDKLAAIPAWVKALFIKWWFAGCVCYLIMMGLGYYIKGNLELWFITALTYGIIVDIMVNPIFRYMESDSREYDIYMMFPFPFKAFWTFFANIAYYMVVMVGVGTLNTLWNQLIFTGLNPLLFATLTLAVDMALIGVKDGIVYGVRKSKRKREDAERLQREQEEAERLAAERAAQACAPEEKSAEASVLERVTEEVLNKK